MYYVNKKWRPLYSILVDKSHHKSRKDLSIKREMKIKVSVEREKGTNKVTN